MFRVHQTHIRSSTLMPNFQKISARETFSHAQIDKKDCATHLLSILRCVLLKRLPTRCSYAKRAPSRYQPKTRWNSPSLAQTASSFTFHSRAPQATAPPEPNNYFRILQRTSRSPRPRTPSRSPPNSPNTSRYLKNRSSHTPPTPLTSTTRQKANIFA